jgi:hypothetical protein
MSDDQTDTQGVQNELAEATNTLNEVIDRVERALYGLGLGVSASVESAAGFKLSFRKFSGEWCLTVSWPESLGVVKLRAAARSVRIAAMAELARLRHEMDTVYWHELAGAREAVCLARAFLENPEGRL